MFSPFPSSSLGLLVWFGTCGLCAGPAGTLHAQSTVDLVRDLRDVLPADTPDYAVAGAGVSGTGKTLFSLEPTVPCGGHQRRLVIVAGLDAKSAGTTAAHDLVRWWFGGASAELRQKWQICVVPNALPDGEMVQAAVFPPQKGYFNDPTLAESRYLWRWTAMSAPDVVLELREADAFTQAANTLGKTLFSTATDAAPDELAGALGMGAPSGLAPVAAVRLQGKSDALKRALRDVLSQSVSRSPLREEYEKRAERDPLDLARLLAGRYPAAPSMSYIPALAWSGALRVSRLTGEDSFRQRALGHMRPFLIAEKSEAGKVSNLPAMAGHLAFSDWAALETQPEAAAFARAAADKLVLSKGAPEVVPAATRWTDDMFMATAVLSRVAGASGDPKYAGAAQRLLMSYAARLQQPGGVFVHVEHSPFAWGRGNGFAAFGVMDALTYLPEKWEGRAALLEIHQKHMRGLLQHQSPDGAWRQVIDQPGAYREFTATAMITTAMARGIRMGWLDADAFSPAVDRGWRAIAVRIAADGSLVDVCTGTGAKKDCDVSYYLRRDAVFGPDDRGGAMALTAALEILDFRKR